MVVKKLVVKEVGFEEELLMMERERERERERIPRTQWRKREK
jgi:hypothetical protein